MSKDNQQPAFLRVLEGESFRAVAKTLGVNESTLRRRFRAAGLSVNRSRGARAVLDDQVAVTLWQMQGSIKQVAQTLGVSETAVDHALRRARVERQTTQPKRQGISLTPVQVDELRRLHGAMTGKTAPNGALSPDRETAEFKAFCAHIQGLRIDHDISLRTIASAVNRSRSAIARWLRESNRPIPARDLC